MCKNVPSLSFLFPVLVYTVFCCEPKEAIPLEQENRFHHVASSWDNMQTAPSSDVLNFACNPDDLECKKMQLRMLTDTNEQDRQRKRCDSCFKSYRCAKLGRCEPCEKICRNQFFREVDNLGSPNSIDDYSTYITLGEFGSGFQMDQIVDLIGLPEKDQYEKVVVIGKTKDQNGSKKCKALLIDGTESFKDIKEGKCEGMVLKKTETEEKVVAPSNIQEYIQAPEDHIITTMGTERTTTVTKDLPVLENTLNFDFTEKGLESANNDKSKPIKNLKSARIGTETTKLGKENNSFQTPSNEATETIEDINELKKSNEKKLTKPFWRKTILKSKSTDNVATESTTELISSSQNLDNLDILRQSLKDSNSIPATDEKLDTEENSKSQLNSLGSPLKKETNENLTSSEYNLDQNSKSSENLSAIHQPKSHENVSTRLQHRKLSRARSNNVPRRHRVSSTLGENNSKNDNEDTLESNLILRQEKEESSQENKTFSSITELPNTTDEVTEVVQGTTDRITTQKSSTVDFLQEEYRDLQQLQKLLFTTPKTDITKKKWREEHPLAIELDKSEPSFEDDPKISDESQNKGKSGEVQNENKLKISKESKKILAIPKTRKNKLGEQQQKIKSANLETKDSLPHSEEVRIQLENKSSQPEVVDDLSDSRTIESEIDDSNQIVEPTLSTALSESAKEEITSSNEPDPTSNVNKKSNTILTSSESRKINTILPLTKQKLLPIVKAKAYSTLKQEQNILDEPSSNITSSEIEGKEIKLISSSQVKDDLEEAPTLDHEENLDSVVEMSRSDNDSTEIPNENLKSTKQKLKSSNRKLKNSKNMVSSELFSEGIDTSSSNDLSSIPKSENVGSEEKLKHTNKKLKAKSTNRMDMNVAHTNQMSDLEKSGETVTSKKQKSFEDYSDIIVSDTPVKSEPSSLENVLKAKHLDSLVHEIEQLPPLIYDRALKVSSALSKLQPAAPPSKNLIDLLSTKELQSEESQRNTIKTNSPDSRIPKPVVYQMKSGEIFENADTTTEEVLGVDSKNDKIISSKENLKSKETNKQFNEDSFKLNIPIKELNEKPLKTTRKDSSLKRRPDKKLKKSFDESNESKKITSVSTTTADDDQVGAPNPELGSKENLFKNFGRVIPNIQDYPITANSLADNLLFLGSDIHLPLNAKKNEDGSYKLSLDIQKLCDCKEAGCNNKHTPEAEEERRNARGVNHVGTFDNTAQDKDKFAAFSDFLGQLRKISKTSSHPEFSKSQYNNEILKLMSSIRPNHNNN